MASGDPMQWQNQSLNTTWQLSNTSSTGGGYVTNITYPDYSQTITIDNTGVFQLEDKSELKSKRTPVGEHDHDIQCCFRVEKHDIVAEYKCSHCDTVLYKKVICKIPKKILKEKCLAKIVKGV